MPLTLLRIPRDKAVLSDQDYHAMESEEIVGRIFMHDGVTNDPWYWTVVIGPSQTGFAATLNDARAQLKAAWEASA